MKLNKVVITGSSTYGVKNHGDDAMLATLVQGLRDEFPEIEITFLCRHPEKTYDRIFGFNSLKNLDHESKDAASGRLFWGFNPGDRDEHLQAIANAISEADLLIIGGNSFMEIFPNSFLKGVSSYAATLATVSKFLGTPFALYGVNVVDKITKETTRQHAHFLASNASAVTLRENSGKELLNDIGVAKNNLHVLGDPAFGIQPRNVDTRQILARQGIILDERPVMGVSFRYEYWNGDESTFGAIGRKLAASLDEIVSVLDIQVIFIPNCTYTHGSNWQDDRLVHREINSFMSQRNHAYCVDEELTIFETLGLYELLSMHITNRRHSGAFAALKSVPFLAVDVSLSAHMWPFMSDLGIPDQLVKMGSSKDLVESIVETWNKRDVIRGAMKPNVDRLIKSARTHVPVILGSCK